MRQVFLVCFAAWLVGCSGPATREPEGQPVAPVLTGLGTLNHKISTNVPKAQQFFDQGVLLVYAFNHDEAARAFREAARHDPNAPMVHWGLALALAPNINDPAPNPEREQEAYDAIQRAVALKNRGSEAEGWYVDALAKRFSSNKGADRLELNKAYAAAMKDVATRLKDDPDAQTLYADAVMNTMPWNYWTKDGHPKPGTLEAIALVEDTMRRWPNHTGANHLYIHLVEATDDPDRALPSAEKLAGLAPNAGHLVHMPAHIFIRTGRYAESAATNRLAVKADQAYLTECRMQGLYPMAYHPHNWHFLWASAAMQGNASEAMRAAQELHHALHKDKIKESEFATLQYWASTPLFTRVRFGQWDEALAEGPPDPALRFTTAVWHYARAMAYLGKGQTAQAEAEQARLRAVAAEQALKDYVFWGANSLPSLLEIAQEVLGGEIAARKGNYDQAIARLERATRLEDGLVYNEPPDWPIPVRQSLGAVLLAAGRPGEAETVYWEDLRRNRNNGWSLHGLTKALAAQKKDDLLAIAEERLREAWKDADVTLVASRF